MDCFLFPCAAQGGAGRNPQLASVPFRAPALNRIAACGVHIACVRIARCSHCEVFALRGVRIARCSHCEVFALRGVRIARCSHCVATRMPVEFQLQSEFQPYMLESELLGASAMGLEKARVGLRFSAANRGASRNVRPASNACSSETDYRVECSTPPAPRRTTVSLRLEQLRWTSGCDQADEALLMSPAQPAVRRLERTTESRVGSLC